MGSVRVVVPGAGAHLPGLAARILDVQEAARRVVFVAADRPFHVVAAALATHGVAVDDLHFVDVVSCLNGGAPKHRPANATFMASPTMLEMLALRVEQAALRNAPAHVVLDSLDTLCLYNGRQPVQEFSHYLANRLRAHGVPGDLVVRDGPGRADLEAMVAPFTDGVLELARKTDA